jgi:hypothetical protein
VVQGAVFNLKAPIAPASGGKITVIWSSNASDKYTVPSATLHPLILFSLSYLVTIALFGDPFFASRATGVRNVNVDPARPEWSSCDRERHFVAKPPRSPDSPEDSSRVCADVQRYSHVTQIPVGSRPGYVLALLDTNTTDVLTKSPRFTIADDGPEHVWLWTETMSHTAGRAAQTALTFRSAISK